MKVTFESWEDKNRRQIAEFTRQWDWDTVFMHWKRRLDDFNVSLSPLFQSIKVYDSKHPTGRLPIVEWWPVDSIRDNHLRIQRNLDDRPGSIGVDDLMRTTNRGEERTLAYLWERKDEPEVVAAILISGSLFSRMESSRKQYPQQWPYFFAVEKLADWARTRWVGSEKGRMWEPACTTVLPAENDDWKYKIESIDALVRYLAEEHVESLIKYRPVVIEFVEEPDPCIAEILMQQKQKRQQQQAEINARRRALEEAENNRLAELKLKHPRFEEWASLSDEELERLVWSKPTIRLAEEFGISDVAIGKRCKQCGVSKPPAGFWARVEAGKIAHPEGKPQI